MTKNNKEDIQVTLFQDAKNICHDKSSFVEDISDILCISTDAAYRRIRGEKRISIDEFIMMCSTYNISPNRYFSNNSKDISFVFSRMTTDIFHEYSKYMDGLLTNFELLSTTKNAEIITLANDIPLFHLLNFPQLGIFKVYSWAIGSGKFEGGFEEFIEKLNDTFDVADVYRQIFSKYNQIPSTEIWTKQTIDPIIRLIDYYYQSGNIKSSDAALTLCYELLELIKNLQIQCNTSTKNTNTEFQFYLSDMEIDNTFIILKNEEMISCIVKLYTIKSMSTREKVFCDETLSWIQNTIRNSTLISGTSQKESFRFFNSMIQRVNFLVERIEKTSNYEYI
jgi:hypothetical protein